MAHTGATSQKQVMPTEKAEVISLGRLAVRRILARFKRGRSERAVARSIRVVSRRTLSRIRENPEKELSLHTYKKLIKAMELVLPPKKKKHKPFGSQSGWPGSHRREVA